MHSPPSPKPHLDTVTLSAAAVTGAASALKDTANCLATGGVKAHHSAPKKTAVVDMHLISQQISELVHRVDTLESSMKTDIRTILEILQHQPGVISRPVPRISSNASQAQQQTQPLQQPPVVPERQLTNTYQATDSEYSSFDLGGPDKQLHHQSSMGTPAGHTVKLTPTQQQHNKQQRGGGGGGGNVQRSISQPECANERNLFT